MKVPFVVALITKDAVEQIPVVVGAHELAVLGMVHGETRVTVDESADLPNGMTEMEFEVEDEYARLEQRYGLHKETKMPHVAMAYGGLDGFAESMERAEAADGAPTTRRAKKTRAAA